MAGAGCVGCGRGAAWPQKVGGGGRQEPSAAGVVGGSSNTAAPRVIDDAVVAAEDHRLGEVARETETRRDVLPVGIGLVARRTATDEPDDSLSSGQWIGRVGIEERELVVLLYPRSLVLIADAEVHREVVPDLPVVLDIGPEILLQRMEARSPGDLTPPRPSHHNPPHPTAALRPPA